MKIDYLSWEAFATLTTGLLAVGAAVLVGLRQVELTRKLHDLQNLSVKEALFDRRIKVYDATREMLQELLVTAKFPEKAFPKFVTEIDRAKFLFPTPVYTRLRLLQTEMANFGFVIDRMNSNYESSGHYGADGVDEKWKTMLGMGALHDELDKIFGDDVRLTL